MSRKPYEFKDLMCKCVRKMVFTRETQYSWVVDGLKNMFMLTLRDQPALAEVVLIYFLC